MKKQLKLILMIFIAAFSSAIAASAQVATGGAFQLDQAVIAGGGGASSDATGNLYKIEGTIGQAIAGSQSGTAPFSVKSGFWVDQSLAPTAAEVSVGGRVSTKSGRCIRNVRVTLTGASGETRTAVTGASGYYRFTDVPAGETYVFSAFAKRYAFAQNTQVRSIMEDTDDINFVADNRNAQPE